MHVSVFGTRCGVAEVDNVAQGSELILRFVRYVSEVCAFFVMQIDTFPDFEISILFFISFLARSVYQQCTSLIN